MHKSKFLVKAAGGAALTLIARCIFRRLRCSPSISSRHDSLQQLIEEGKKAVCVGKNYRDHIVELADLGPEWKVEEEEEPVLFIKPTTSYAWPGHPLVLPHKRATSTAGPPNHGVHHELELAVIIGPGGAKDIQSEGHAMECVAGYVLALDMTERDEQTAAKIKGMPWTVSKGYDTFCPLSHPFQLSGADDWRHLRMWLDVNGERRQYAEAGAMIHSVPRLIMFISSVMTLEPGDLILTGTPKGVGPVLAGDRITAGITGHADMAVEVVARPTRRCDDAFILRPPPSAIPPSPMQSPRGSLSGLTFAAKDNLDVAGLVTGNGSPDWAQTKGAAPLVTAHAPAVAALLGAGARLVGKTHMDELAFSIAGENGHYGTLPNPTSPWRTVGGSSSGSAVSVASGAVDVALGSDTTGSVRVPAGHCGVFGMRPTHGAVSTGGVCELAPTFDTVGWFARTADHLSAVGRVLLPPPPAALPAAAPPKVLLATDALDRYKAPDERTRHAARGVADEVAGALASMSSAGRVVPLDLGAEILAACPTLHAHYGTDSRIDGLAAVCALMRELQAGEIYSSLGEWAETVAPELGRTPALTPEVQTRLAWARETSRAATFQDTHDRRHRAREEVGAALEALLGDGTVLCYIPVAAPPPPPGAADTDLAYRARTFELQGPSGVGGLPQIVLPAGVCAVTGLPLPVALLAARGHDHRLLGLGEAIASRGMAAAKVKHGLVGTKVVGH